MRKNSCTEVRSFLIKIKEVTLQFVFKIKKKKERALLVLAVLKYSAARIWELVPLEMCRYSGMFPNKKERKELKLSKLSKLVEFYSRFLLGLFFKNKITISSALAPTLH